MDMGTASMDRFNTVFYSTAVVTPYARVESEARLFKGDRIPHLGLNGVLPSAGIDHTNMWHSDGVVPYQFVIYVIEAAIVGAVPEGAREALTALRLRLIVDDREVWESFVDSVCALDPVLEARLHRIEDLLDAMIDPDREDEALSRAREALVRLGWRPSVGPDARRLAVPVTVLQHGRIGMKLTVASTLDVSEPFMLRVTLRGIDYRDLR